MSRYRYKRTHSIKNKRYILYIIMLFFVMGIGYAALTSNLSISGNTEIVSNTWNIHFENVREPSSTAEIINHATISGTKNNIVTYGIKLKNSGDIYEFRVDVKNDGSLPGEVSISTMNGLTEEAATYIDYTVTYTDGSSVDIGDVINPGSFKTVVVKVFYKEGVSVPSDLNLSLYFNLEYSQAMADTSISAAESIIALATDNTCISKYSGQVTDEVGVTKTADNVYYDKCSDKRNIIFGGFCWQAIRTTETGGVKMVYNGEPVNGKCESTRGTHKGIVQNGDGASHAINTSYLYGESFTYDTTNNNFTLVDTFTETFSDSTYERLIGRFTCKTNNNTCSNIYRVNCHESNTNSCLYQYVVGNTNYAQIGTSVFSDTYHHSNLTNNGYMYNTIHPYGYEALTGTITFSSTYTYSNGTYTLSGTTQNISDWSSTNYGRLSNTHYTCGLTSTSCSVLYYITTLIEDNGGTGAYYYELRDGKDISDILDEMFIDESVNKFDSNAKGIIEAWYAQNLDSYSNKIEDAIYCNARVISSLGGFDSNGGSTDLGNDNYISFRARTGTTNLSCPNITDQFSMSNHLAKTKYSIGLYQMEDYFNIYSDPLMATGNSWWSMSPGVAHVANGYMTNIDSTGDYTVFGSFSAYGLRPVISLSANNSIASGSGSETDPWIVE